MGKKNCHLKKDGHRYTKTEIKPKKEKRKEEEKKYMEKILKEAINYVVKIIEKKNIFQKT